MEIKKDESEIIGKWEFINGKYVQNDTCKRIEYLKKKYLLEITKDESGWYVLYKDPNDGRYWESKYLQSDLHGGGIPALINIKNDLLKYQLKWDKNDIQPISSIGIK
ncbi:Imm27 family immunity protein [Kordia sp.]|uniref:Imm27 family immunity protein n=1 Tax=Kordia sp. TaxID=1965332 RepID=UPI003D27CB1F